MAEGHNAVFRGDGSRLVFFDKGDGNINVTFELGTSAVKTGAVEGFEELSGLGFDAVKFCFRKMPEIGGFGLLEKHLARA